MNGAASYSSTPYSSLTHVKFTKPSTLWTDIDTMQVNRWVEVIEPTVDIYEGPMNGAAAYATTPYSAITHVKFTKPNTTWTDINITQDPNWKDIKAA